MSMKRAKDIEIETKKKDLEYWELVYQKKYVQEYLIRTPPFKVRKCLRCQNKFESNGNRVCGRCNQINSRQGEMGKYNI